MASSDYWMSQITSLKTPEFDSGKYYNQSFADRIKEAQANIDNLVSARDQANAKVQESQDAYDTFKGEMRHYSEISDEKENEFGVTTAMDNYNQSKDAIAATQAAINALPSSINANSNRVLTQSQRTAAYQSQYAAYSRKMGVQSSAASEYEKVWEQARTNATRAAAAEWTSDQNQLADFNKAWTAALNNWNTAKKNILVAQAQRRDIEAQFREWQHKQYMDELDRYYSQIQSMYKKYYAAKQDEFNRWKQEKAEENRLKLAQIDAEATRRMADDNYQRLISQSLQSNNYGNTTSNRKFTFKTKYIGMLGV